MSEIDYTNEVFALLCRFAQGSFKYNIYNVDGNFETIVQVTKDKSTGILHDGTYAYYPYGKDNDAYRIGALIVNNGKITNVKLFSNTTSEHKDYIAKGLAQSKKNSRSGK